jgi:2-polyprenyl-3-methyl-5-hydroxy-6-metoxy-1,4-benzoquinol methylase
MNLEKIERCPLCGYQSLKPFISCLDYTVSQELFHVEQCEACKFTLTNPRPIQSEAGKFYQSSDYISHTSKSKSLMDRIYLIIRSFTLRWKFSLVKSHLHNKHLLDIGCGTGDFGKYCSTQGVTVYGVEPSQSARDLASSKGILTFESLDEIQNVKFSVITLWHVLEHIYDLDIIFQKIKSLLTDDGTIFIAVPNHESHDAMHYKQFWAAFDVPRHVWHFSKITMESCLNKNKLSLKEKSPMKLDAYYVSLLSEKYKGDGSLTLSGIFRATWAAFKSNSKAKVNMNYSSIIYQVKK